MDVIVDQITALAADANEATRKSMLLKLRDCSYALESIDDTTIRIWGGHVSTALVRSGINLKLFEHLSKSGQPMSVTELSSRTNADETLLARLLRALASFGIIKESGLNEFQRTNVSDTLARPGEAATIKHYFDVCGPVYQEFPAWFERHGYKNPIDAYDTVWQDAWKSKHNCFEWMMGNQEAFANFNLYMAARRENQTTWFEKYPVSEDLSPNDPELTADRVLLIDVGGGLGHQAVDFRAKFLDMPGKVVNMDLPFAVEHAKSVTGPRVEHIAHDFFEPQPVKGAKYYYLRAILHDWPDDKCRTILKNQIDAMAEDSIILIDDMVLPDQGVPWQVTQVDITMMLAGASMERTVTQWDALYDSVGLKILRRAVYTPGVYETVTALVKK